MKGNISFERKRVSSEEVRCRNAILTQKTPEISKKELPFKASKSSISQSAQIQRPGENSISALNNVSPLDNINHADKDFEEYPLFLSKKPVQSPISNTAPPGENSRQRVKGLIKIEVMDTGIGISKQAREKLFQRYQQADASISQYFFRWDYDKKKLWRHRVRVMDLKVYCSYDGW